VTAKENMIHAARVLGRFCWENNSRSKLKQKDVDYIRSMKWIMCGDDMARLYWVSWSCISNILNNKKRKSGVRKIG
jgi:hypothetical protein